MRVRGPRERDWWEECRVTAETAALAADSGAFAGPRAVDERAARLRAAGRLLWTGALC